MGHKAREDFTFYVYAPLPWWLRFILVCWLVKLSVVSFQCEWGSIKKKLYFKDIEHVLGFSRVQFFLLKTVLELGFLILSTICSYVHSN